MATPHEAVEGLVLAHRVCWDVVPLYSVTTTPGRKRLVQVGFEVVLAGGFDPSTPTPLPGSPAVDGLFRNLREIATAALPPDDIEIDHEIEHFDHSIAEPKKRRRQEVQLKIAITHHVGFQRPVDSHEVEYLRLLEARLRQLGACKGDWDAPHEA